MDDTKTFSDIQKVKEFNYQKKCKRKYFRNKKNNTNWKCRSTFGNEEIQNNDYMDKYKDCYYLNLFKS